MTTDNLFDVTTWASKGAAGILTKFINSILETTKESDSRAEDLFEFRYESDPFWEQEVRAILASELMKTDEQVEAYFASGGTQIPEADQLSLPMLNALCVFNEVCPGTTISVVEKSTGNVMLSYDNICDLLEYQADWINPDDIQEG